MNNLEIWNIALIAVVIWLLYRRFAPIKGLRFVNERELQDELRTLNNKVLIDVREPHEYKRGFIKGAINIPLSQLKNRIHEVPRDKEVYLYCQSGMRSKQAGRILSKHGHGNLSHLQGGILSWKGKINGA